jgi:flagellar biosynthesis protein FlhF
MKIIRHIAPDMRQALRAIRTQLGDDAVILSSRRIAEGVEVTAAIDFDAADLQNAMNTSAESLTAAPLPSPPGPAVASRQIGIARAPAAVPTLAPPTINTAASQHQAPSYAAAASAVAYGSQPASALGHSTGASAYTTAEPPRAYSHSAASHYFSAPPTADVRPFAHVLGPDPGAAAVIAPPVPVKDVMTAVPDTPPARREPTLNMAPAKQDYAAQALAELPQAASHTNTGDSMGSELKTLRRMLETQLAQLAWNDLTRRAPVHVEILRELTEIGITQDLADYILKQLPEKVELGFARRFAIAGLSQYLLVTGDRWLENGGRVAFIGATGVGKTTTIAKLAVRWVLRHGPRDLALVGCDTVRIGAQDQIQSLGQLLGVPVYTPENFESLPTLLTRLRDRHRLILIDTPGSSLRDAQLPSRLGVLSNCASQMETALVLAASTQAGALEETVKRFAPANPACCVLTKLDEAASLGGALSALIRARVPVSYVSEGQRVPEDLRPARALELVSTAVRLAKASGAAADEDLLRRRFGKTANAIT